MWRRWVMRCDVMKMGVGWWWRWRLWQQLDARSPLWLRWTTVIILDFVCSGCVIIARGRSSSSGIGCVQFVSSRRPYQIPCLLATTATTTHYMPGPYIIAFGTVEKTTLLTIVNQETCWARAITINSITTTFIFHHHHLFHHQIITDLSYKPSS